MRKWLDRYYGTLRKIKGLYVLLNLFNLRKLAHARRMYHKYGIQRSVLMPVNSSILPATRTEELPWLDTEQGVAQLAAHPGLQRFDEATRQGILAWPANGYLVIRGLFSPQEVNEINAEIDRLIRDKVVDFNFTGRKIMFAFHHSEVLRRYVHDRRILDVMDFLLGRQMRVFQSINFLTGSEQAAHSDSIHMTTHPLGYMTAAWIALERITPDNGPLVYHPGSHRLPYLLNGQYDHGGNRFVIGQEAYLRYEQAIERSIAEGNFERSELLAEPGDVLFWHANLLHGGKKMSTPNASRKSMVIHCFADDVLCYHELTQRAAMMEDHH
ncbi:MAG: phytanoyl-CoA dioxygenase family protein [Flavobacteriales bacterium]|jgi:ectoine hydroxylase-related dioxygenase (phytanoyl-CoA dioxygenase family)|nr:phytanoyl-CoA dioxygenase family protein [Flavobacteriales bacterium]